MTTKINSHILNNISHNNHNINLLRIHIGLITITFFQIFSFKSLDSDLLRYKQYLYFLSTQLIAFLYFTFIYRKFLKEKERLKEFLTSYVLSLIFSICVYRIFISNDFYLIQIYIYLISL